MNKIIRRLLQTGIADIENINNEEQSDEFRRIYLTNLIAFVLGISALPYIFVFNALDLILLSIVTGPVSIAFFSCIYLNKLRLYSLAGISLTLIACIAALFYGIFLGIDIGIQNLFFAWIFIPFFVFRRKKEIIIMESLVLSFYLLLIIGFYFSNNNEPLLKTTDTKGKIFFLFGNLTVICWMIFNFYHYSTSVTVSFNNKIKNRNKKIQIAKEELKISEATREIKETKNRELRIVNEKLKKSRAIQENLAYKAALGTLIMGIHHEIRNPLNIIRVSCQSIPIKINDKDYIVNTCKGIIEAIDRLNEISTSMLEYGRESSHDIKKIEINSTLYAIQKEIFYQVNEQ